MIWMSHLDSDLAGSLYAPVILASPVLQSARRRKKNKGRRGRGGEGSKENHGTRWAGGCGQLQGSPAVLSSTQLSGYAYHSLPSC